MAINPNRTVNVPAPFFGIRPGFNIGDLTLGFQTPIEVITAVTVTTTSAVQNIGTRGIEVSVEFSNQVTSCDVVITDTTTSSVVWTQTGVAFGANKFYVSGFEGVDLQGDTFTVKVQNIQGGGSVSVFIRKTN